MEKKYRLLTSIAGTDCSFRVKEIVVAGDAHGEGVMERSMLEALIRGDGYVEEVVDDKETKKSKASVAATAVRSQVGVETAEARPV